MGRTAYVSLWGRNVQASDEQLHLSNTSDACEARTVRDDMTTREMSRIKSTGHRRVKPLTPQAEYGSADSPAVATPHDGAGQRALEDRVQAATGQVRQEDVSIALGEVTARKADVLSQKRELPESDAQQHHSLPSDYETATGRVDWKRKRALSQYNDGRGEKRDRRQGRGARTRERGQREDRNDNHNQKKVRYESQWESDQLKRAQAIVTSNPDQIELVDQKHYDFVFDESQLVDFAENTELAGDEGEPKPTVSDIQSVRKSLPAFKQRQAFLDVVAANQVVVVVGETGSGKTTQLPQYLYEAGYHQGPSGAVLKIGCTQPRRVAATSVARRVAEEMGCSLGREVGYSIRFDDQSSSDTVIKYLTDGMLLREFVADPMLSAYSCVMIDEAHERTVSTEIVLSLLKDISVERKDLKIIVASATINADKFAEYFHGAPIFRIPGRRFPVTVSFTRSPEANYIQAALTTVLQIHTKQETPGDILVFLTGQEEIETMEETLNDACAKLGHLIRPLIVAPIYANLPPNLQARIFRPTPANARKVVLATNIAETSITIDGVKYVVDSGYVKETVFNPTTGMESLVVVPCSRASADQRAGRAGRVGPGKCYRLYTKWSFYNELPETGTPEIMRSNLSSVVLLLLSIGVTDLVNFDFMDPPSHHSLIRCLDLLYALGALNSRGQLTETGRKMAEFPMDPMFCKALLTAEKYSVADDVLSVISMLSESATLFYRPKDKREQADKMKERFAHPAGDHLSLLNIWNQWRDSGYLSLWCEDHFLQYRTLKRIRDVRGQLEKLCCRVGVFPQSNRETDVVSVQKAIFSGFFPNVARLSQMGNSYILLKKNQQVHIHPSSTLFRVVPPTKLILYHELVLTSKEYMRHCIVIEEKWITELAGHYYHKKALATVD